MSDSGKRPRPQYPTQALPGIKYFNITTRWDENAFPYTTNLMTGRGDYENLVTQKQCRWIRLPHHHDPHSVGAVGGDQRAAWRPHADEVHVLGTLTHRTPVRYAPSRSPAAAR